MTKFLFAVAFLTFAVVVPALQILSAALNVAGVR